MESGIITKAGEFITCDGWKHIATAYQNDTSDQFILCRNDVGYGGGFQVIDIVGELNKKMLNALFDFATRNGVALEDVAACGLEDELLSYSNPAPNKSFKRNC